LRLAEAFFGEAFFLGEAFFFGERLLGDGDLLFGEGDLFLGEGERRPVRLRLSSTSAIKTLPIFN